MSNKKPVGRPEKEGERKVGISVSIYPSFEVTVKNKFSSVTRFLEICSNPKILSVIEKHAKKIKE